MLPKNKRVKRDLFPKAFSLGKTFHSAYLTVRVVFPQRAVSAPKETSHTTPLTASRFSFVVSKAVAKKAVDRNLLRRRGYSAVSKFYDSLPQGLIIIFFYKKGAGGLSYSVLSGEIKNLLDKAGLLKEDRK